MQLQYKFGQVKRIHLIGIGGVGMGGIAEVLINQGYQVSGSDQSENAMTQRLRDLGADIFIGHHAAHLQQAEVVVRSTAISDTNAEIQAARARRVPVISRAQMLTELMRFSHGIAVAGTHGKTTTTSLVASVMIEAGLDPTYVIGGKLNQADAHAKLGTGEYFVAEADESDASFLLMQPMIAVITNIDQDHMETYDNNFNRLKKAFLEFIHHLPFYGCAVLCLDNPEVAALRPKIQRRYVTYGFGADADFRAMDYHQDGLVSRFKLHRSGHDPLSISLNLPGRHNVHNALAAIAVALECGADEAAVCRALAKFEGVGRRFQLHGDYSPEPGRQITAIEDYGHHPCELRVTIEAMRAVWPGRRLMMVFQPHRFSRTRDCFDDFVSVLSEVDVLVLLPVYPGGETAIEGADSAHLATALAKTGMEAVHVIDDADLPAQLPPLLANEDIVLFQGAGSVGKIASNLLTLWG